MLLTHMRIDTCIASTHGGMEALAASLPAIMLQVVSGLVPPY